MKRRACDSCFWRSSSWPQYGQRFQPSGYVFLHALQRTLFGRGIVNRRALYTSTPVDEDRRRTLQTLLDLAGDSSPTACWDDARAIALLRSQATADELRELGASESLIAHIFAETHAG